MRQLFDWISVIISSCTDDFHFEAVDKLIDLFYERTKDEKITTELRLKRALKWNEIHAIVKPELNK